MFPKTNISCFIMDYLVQIHDVKPVKARAPHFDRTSERKLVFESIHPKNPTPSLQPLLQSHS